ncbi:arylformamidase [Aequitasia blattaphilus]|uniref:Cyclase family protein n=1 Tax=Aequitasia blattaphilus TaxID=2949332 RepID=A0ABT1E7Z4_9FIRM|nr:cyclase family protein [Aequitasia blattaphilus]MCP1101952.1 cyclase family protein [Aequitasia blattaphilus]MCR8614592.1 cyclase family protein [Aequitasia blattaphilus]
MKIYDITKELFSTPEYPGDPSPGFTQVYDMKQGDTCNLTNITFGAHNGTHLDAPKHFVQNGKDVESMELSRCIGECKVVSHQGDLTKEAVQDYLEDGTKKLLLKGSYTITKEAAKEMTLKGMELLGVVDPTVGAEEGVTVHKILLRNEVVILENLNLDGITEGKYFISALPLRMRGIEGSPVRAVLIDFT